MKRSMAALVMTLSLAVFVPNDAHAVAAGENVCFAWANFEFGEDPLPRHAYVHCKDQRGEEFGKIDLLPMSGEVRVGFTVPSNFAVCDNSGEGQCTAQAGEAHTLSANDGTVWWVEGSEVTVLIACSCL